MIDPELRTLAELAMSEARRRLAQGEFRPYFEIRLPDGEHHKIDQWPAHFLDDRHLKHALFRTLRAMAVTLKLTGVLFVSDLWLAKLTVKGMAMNLREIERLGAAHDRFQRLVDRGLAERTEALQVVAQTPTAVLWIMQPYLRGPDGEITYGTRDESEGDWSTFAGDVRIFGVDDPLLDKLKDGP